MNDNNTLYATTLGAIAVLALVWNGRRSGTKPPFPPGPKRLPLLGNLLDVPRGIPIWQTFTTVAKKFGMYPLALYFPSTLLKRRVRRQQSDLSEVIYNRVRRPQQLRGYLGLGREALRHLF